MPRGDWAEARAGGPALGMVDLRPPVGVLTYQADGSCSHANPMAAELLGVSRDLLLGEPLGTLGFWRDLGLLELAQAAMKKGISSKGVAPVVNAMGDSLQVDWRLEPVLLAGEGALLVLFMDITRFYEIDAVLRASRERYRQLVDETPDLIFSLDSSGCLTAANKSLAAMAGRSVTDLVGRPLPDVGLPTQLVEQWEQVRPSVLDTGVASEVETAAVMADGTPCVLTSTMRPITSEEGTRTGTRVHATDITQRKQAEKALRLTQMSVDQAADPIYWVGPDAEILYASDSMCRRHGYSREELLGMTIFDLDPDLSTEVWSEHWRRMEKKGSLTLETTHKTKDGSVFPVEVTTNFVEHDGRKYQITFGRDISERKEAEEALRESEERLRQSQKMEAVGQLAGGIAHDFNNLLTAIIGNSYLALAAMSPEDPNRPLVADIYEVGERAAGLTRQILAFSRHQVLRPCVLCLNDILASMEPLLRRTLGEDIELYFFLAADLMDVEVDPSQMEQVLMNLAVNARDALPQGGSLTVETTNVVLDKKYARTHAEVESGPHVMLAVTDTGCGMDKETASRVFEPFFTTKEVGKGTGLGLSTVFGIVKQSGGSISVYSEPGKGTTFKVYLPQASEPASPTEVPSEEKREPAAGGQRILVVEDDPWLRALVVRALSLEGYQVTEAESAGDVRTILKEEGEAFALLLTDVVLPGGSNGPEIAEMLRMRQPGLRVLYMSGYPRNFIVHNGRLDEGIEFLEKPFTPDKLVRRVGEVLGR